jgi:hypothetical protein
MHINCFKSGLFRQQNIKYACTLIKYVSLPGELYVKISSRKADREMKRIYLCSFTFHLKVLSSEMDPAEIRLIR